MLVSTEPATTWHLGKAELPRGVGISVCKARRRRFHGATSKAPSPPTLRMLSAIKRMSVVASPDGQVFIIRRLLDHMCMSNPLCSYPNCPANTQHKIQ